MPTIPISNAGAIGVIQDRKPHELPPNAWSDALNVRMRNGFVEKFNGHSKAFGTPTVAPYNLIPAPTATGYLWLYLGLAKAYAYDGTNHTDVTRAVGGDYTATADQNWVVTNFQGIPVVTDGNDIPQQWLPASTGQRLAALANWNANWTTRAIRSYKQFLVALDVTKTGTRNPYMVKWSHPAVVGAVPSSWDEMDTTKDAGEYELSDSGGWCLDGITLRDTFIIYKEDAIWGMQFVGGTKVMRFFKIFDTIGALSRRCAVEFFNGKHFVFGTNDIIVHDGQNKISLLDDKLRKWWFNQINPTTYMRSFITIDNDFSEVWACAPTGSATLPDKAVVWGWKDNTLTVRDLPSVAGSAIGINNTGSVDTWNLDSGTWDSDPSPWDTRVYNPSVRKMFLARPSVANILLADDTNQFDMVDPTAYVERTGFGVPFVANAPPDTESIKFLSAVWPRIEGTVGGVVKVYVGSSQRPGDTPVYQAPQDFVIGTTKQIPCRVSGRLLAFKFLSNTNLDWRLHGYDIDVKQIGRF